MPVAIAPFADCSSRTSSWVSTTSSVRAKTRSRRGRARARRAGGRPSSSSVRNRPFAFSSPARRSCATTSIRPEPQRPRGSTSAPPITWSSTSPFVSTTPSIAPSVARMPQRICPPSNAGPAGAAVATDPLLVAAARSRRSCPTSTRSRFSGSRARPVATMSPTMSAPTYAPIDGNSATRPSGWIPKPASAARRSCASRNVATNGESAIDAAPRRAADAASSRCRPRPPRRRARAARPRPRTTSSSSPFTVARTASVSFPIASGPVIACPCARSRRRRTSPAG